MELRHLRYFVAVAEEGSVTLAAERRLHTAQPSLSRQLRDLEREVGAQLLDRSVHGIELTAAGRAFLDHARLALAQVEAAGDAARRASHPAKATFVMGFLTGTEMDWFPEAVRLLHDELPSIEVILVSQTSPELASALLRSKVDVAFLRPEPEMPDLVLKRLTSEPLFVILPSDHRLAVLEAISPRDIEGETFVNVSDTASTLRVVIDDYLRIALLPRYAQNFLPRSLVSRPLQGPPPTIDLVLGYHNGNRSPLLKLFLSRVDDLIAHVSQRSGDRGGFQTCRAPQTA